MIGTHPDQIQAKAGKLRRLQPVGKFVDVNVERQKILRYAFGKVNFLHTADERIFTEQDLDQTLTHLAGHAADRQDDFLLGQTVSRGLTGTAVLLLVLTDDFLIAGDVLIAEVAGDIRVVAPASVEELGRYTRGEVSRSSAGNLRTCSPTVIGSGSPVLMMKKELEYTCCTRSRMAVLYSNRYFISPTIKPIT